MHRFAMFGKTIPIQTNKQTKMQLTVKQEFKKLIPPLTFDEFKQLEANILNEGIRDPLIIWGDVLLDGHNRYEIATKHNIPFTTVERFFDKEDDAKEWMILNQFGRRNLSNYQRSVLALDLEHIFAEKAKLNQLSSLRQNTVPKISWERDAKVDKIESDRKEKYDKIWSDNAMQYDTKVRLTDSLTLQTNKERKNVLDKERKVLYVVRTLSKIKVGSTINIHSRLDVLRTSDPDIELVATFEGGSEIEKHVLNKFAEKSIGGEWFAYSDDLLSSILLYAKKESERVNETSHKISKVAGVSHDTIAKVKVIQAKATEEVKEKLSSGNQKVNNVNI